MIELSRYTLEALRKDEEFILYRGRSQGDAPGVLVLSPVLTCSAVSQVRKPQTAGARILF